MGHALLKYSLDSKCIHPTDSRRSCSDPKAPLRARRCGNVTCHQEARNSLVSTHDTERHCQAHLTVLTRNQ